MELFFCRYLLVGGDGYDEMGRSKRIKNHQHNASSQDNGWPR
jgi:hypothetical protein